MRIFGFEAGEEIAKSAADGARTLRTAAGNDRNAEVGCVVAGDVLGDEDEGTDQAEIAITRVGDGRKRAQLAGEHGVAEQGFAEIVGGVAEGDDVGSEVLGDFIDRAAALARAEIAAVVGLFLEEIEGGVVAEVGPRDASLLEICAERFDGPEKFSLFDGEGADGEIDGRALLQEQESLEQSGGVLAAGEGDGDSIAITDHFEFGDSFPDLAE